MNQSTNSSPQNPASENPSYSRYQRIRELGRNAQGSCITYLAKDNKIQRTVVIKQYIFGDSQSDWAGLKAYETQAKALLNLKHLSLPRYLNFYSSKDGFCAVREFQQATSLAAFRHLNLGVIHKIAVSLLETLIYLQNRSPCLLHYNIKPENILVDDRLNIYLVDFGFPYISKQGKMRTSFAGTPGFMPPEQLRNQDLTEASEVYAVGVSLVCLVTQTTSEKIDRLLGVKSHVSLAEIIPKEISLKFVEWLEELLKPSLNQRYANASTALEALNAIDLKRSPQAKIKPHAIELKSTKYGEKLVTTIAVHNTVPDTLLQGKWELGDRDNRKNLPASRLSWLVFDPPNFEGDRIKCDVIIDTKKMKAEQIYERKIILHANDEDKIHEIDLKIETAPLAIEKLPWLQLVGLTIIGLLGGGVFRLFFAGVFLNYMSFLLGLILGGISGIAGIFNNYSLPKKMLGIAVLLSFFPNTIPLCIATLIGLLIFSIAGYILRYGYDQPLQKKDTTVLKEILSTQGLMTLLIAFFGVSLGLESNAGSFNPAIIFTLILTGVPIIIMLYRFYANQMKVLADYRKSEPRLLKP